MTGLVDVDPQVVEAVSAAVTRLVAKHDPRALQLAVAFVAGSMSSVAARRLLYPTREHAIEAACAALSAGLVGEGMAHLRRTPPSGRA